MIYRFGITTPANTAEANKQKTLLKLCQGVIHQIDITFPAGPAGLLKMHINRGLYQVWPNTASQVFAADDTTISFREHFELNNSPFELEAWTWNLDDTYEHDIIIRIGILKRKFILRRLF